MGVWAPDGEGSGLAACSWSSDLGALASAALSPFATCVSETELPDAMPPLEVPGGVRVRLVASEDARGVGVFVLDGPVLALPRAILSSFSCTCREF